MNRISKIITIIILIIIMTPSVLANDTYELIRRRHPNEYAIYFGKDRTHIFYSQTYIINSMQAYCLEPGVKIDNETYQMTNDLSLSGLSNEVLEKIKLIAYYGFRYPGHQNDQYYMATQELIWRAITDAEVYWVTEEDINGPRINIDNEKNTITELINTHKIIPSFANETINVEPSNTIELTDTNNVLNKFKIKESSITNAKIIGNKLIINPNSISETGEIILETNLYTNEPFHLFHNGDNQKIISALGMVTPTQATIKVKVNAKPRIKVIKIDSSTNKEIKKTGIQFKIKNKDTQEYICEATSCLYQTDDTGSFITDNTYDFGTYILEEIKPPNGYLINKEPFEFTIDESTTYEEENNIYYKIINFKNTPVTGKVILNKVGENPIYKNNLITYEDIPLNDISFSLYAKENIYDINNNIIHEKDSLIGNYKTISGKITIDNLPLGSYYFKEVATNNEYILDNEIYSFALEYKDSETPIVTKEITIKNYLKKGILDFTKKDFLTNEPLPNTKVAIYNDKDELIFSDYTNDLGKLILEGLPIGKYYIKELIAPEGYLLSDEIIHFTISNDEITKVAMDNITIDVPSTSLTKKSITIILSIGSLLGGIGILLYDKK